MTNNRNYDIIAQSEQYRSWTGFIFLLNPYLVVLRLFYERVPAQEDQASSDEIVESFSLSGINSNT